MSQEQQGNSLVACASASAEASAEQTSVVLAQIAERDRDRRFPDVPPGCQVARSAGQSDAVFQQIQLQQQTPLCVFVDA